MMFKALLIQSLYNLSDDQLEYQIVDRASFKRFLGLKKIDKVPDSKTFWAFREHLIEKEVIEKGYRNKPLTDEQKASNKEKSRIRAGVEHLFGFVENSMNGSIVRTIGLPGVKAKIGMMNLTYNICRCVQLKLVVTMGYAGPNVKVQLCNILLYRLLRLAVRKFDFKREPELDLLSNIKIEKRGF